MLNALTAEKPTTTLDGRRFADQVKSSLDHWRRCTALPAVARRANSATACLLQRIAGGLSVRLS